MKFSFKYISLIIAFVFAFQFSVNAQEGNNQPQPAAQNLKTVKIKVSGVTCAGDCRDIQEVVGKLNGVDTVKQVGKPSATSVFEVSYNPMIVSEKEIYKAVEGTPGCKDPADRPYKVKKG